MSKLQKADYKKISIQVLYFALWTLIPLISIAFTERRHEEAYIMSISFGIIFTAVASFFNFSKVFYFLTLPLFLVPGFIEMGHIGIFKGRISPDVFFTLFDTNIAEARDFVWDYLTLGLVSLLIIYFIVMFVLFYSALRNSVSLTLKQKSGLLAVGILPLLLAGIQRTGAPWTERMGAGLSSLKITTSYLHYQEQIKRYESLQRSLTPFSEDVALVKEGRVTHVIGIGESSNKNHWGIYGYSRQTTPRLSKRKELQVYKRVLCPTPPQTIWNIQKLLTFSNTENLNPSNFTIQPSILQIAKKVGFKIFWITNQRLLGEHDDMTTILSKQADVTKFLNVSNGFSFDDKLLTPLDEALADPAEKKIILLHFFGNHAIYKERYPSEYNHFVDSTGISSPFNLTKKSTDLINFYDNSVLYHDYVLDEVLKRVQEKADSFVYLPDHGEEVFDDADFRGHHGGIPTKGMYQIPLLFWAKDISSDIVVDLNRTFISENLIFSLSQLYGFDYSSLDLSKSLWSRDYRNDYVLKVKSIVVEY